LSYIQPQLSVTALRFTTQVSRFI